MGADFCRRFALAVAHLLKDKIDLGLVHPSSKKQHISFNIHLNSVFLFFSVDVQAGHHNQQASQHHNTVPTAQDMAAAAAVSKNNADMQQFQELQQQIELQRLQQSQQMFLQQQRLQEIQVRIQNI